MNSSKTLSGPSFLPHKKPKKLIFMLHGYGDSGDNFIHLSKTLNIQEWKANFIALNAPTFIPTFPSGRQWFNLYPNGIYISDAGEKEIAIIKKEISESLVLLKNTIDNIKNTYKLSYTDCFLLGFSQGGMMTFEFGNYINKSLAGLAILSGRIISNEIIRKKALSKTPIFISHGDKDDVLPIKFFDISCNYLKTNNLRFESHILDGDGHTISFKAINLLQKFIKKNYDVIES